MTGCRNGDFESILRIYEINVTKAKTLELGISRSELISEMKDDPLAYSGLAEGGKYEVLYFETPPTNSQHVAALIEVNNQRVVGFRIYEGTYRSLDEYNDVVRKVLAPTYDGVK